MIFELPPLPETVPAAKCPFWSLERVEHRSCPVCNSDNPQAIVKRPDKLIVHCCSICGMIYLADIPCKEEIYNLYERYGSFKGCTPAHARISWLRKWLNNKRNAYISILRRSGGIKGLSICEIGCSYGGFLELLRYEGGDVYGVEIDINAQRHLREKGITGSTEIPHSQKFDIVCLLQVVEHLINPLDIISSVSRILSSDGRLLVSVPNAGEYLKAGPSWIGFRVDFEHLNYFDLHSLSQLLRQHNLFVEHFWEHLQPSIQRRMTIQKQYCAIGLMKKGLEKIKTIANWIFEEQNIFNQGSFVLTVVARKI